MHDPFRITGPAIISFSGGRTSAYMLWRILQAHDGTLPDDVVVVFANTGREMEATLNFVAACGNHWGVHINWLEYHRDPDTGHVWTEVASHNSASRQGEPFRAALAGKQMLPNPVTRFCTEELKIRTVKRFVQRELGWKRWRNYVGLRSDEMHRVVRIAKRNADRREPFFASCPLAKARCTSAGHVMPFWKGEDGKSQPQGFDLMLKGKWEGNCDLCFLKNLAARRRMIQDYPELAQAWADDEADPRLKAGTIKEDARFYRKDVPGYATLIEQERRNPRLPFVDEIEAAAIGDGFDPFAACDSGCGI